MTISQILNYVRSLGLLCRWDAMAREFRINFPMGDEDTAYYCDRDDAIPTAQYMASELSTLPY